MLRHLTALLIMSFFATNLVFGQNEDENDGQEEVFMTDTIEKKVLPTGNIQRADRLFFNENYKAALQEYLLILERDPEDTKVNYNAGLCLLNSDFDKVKSLPYFQKVVFYDDEAATVYYLIGKAYQADMRFDRAIENFNKYIEFYASGDDFSIEEAEIEIEYCENAYQLMKFPRECVYENLGEHINSPYPDYFPFVTLDESFLAFTSKRDDGSTLLPDGTYSSNIYYSKVVDGEYTDAVHLPGADNKPSESEVVIGMSNDGKNMLLMKGEEGLSGDIFEADFENDQLENVVPLGERINQERSREIAATYGIDRNTVYFVSDREGGYGGTDIWVAKKLPIGKWGLPYNAGPGINTERDEDFPNLSPDGKTLFFSSKGHFSMGGFDIFQAKWDPDSNAYVNPRNLGYPVNSVDDDMNYRQSASGRYGYISALRPEGYGDYDIYRLTITEIDPEFTVLRGVLSADRGELSGTNITVTEISTGELFGTYTPNQNTQRYVIILPPGEFDVYITADDREPVAFTVKVLGKSSFEPEVVRDIIMVSK